MQGVATCFSCDSGFLCSVTVPLNAVFGVPFHIATPSRNCCVRDPSFGWFHPPWEWSLFEISLSFLWSIMVAALWVQPTSTIGVKPSRTKIVRSLAHMGATLYLRPTTLMSSTYTEKNSLAFQWKYRHLQRFTCWQFSCVRISSNLRSPKEACKRRP